jgi:hypothetical protein
MTKIKEEYERLVKAEENLEKILLKGDMLGFENSLLSLMGELYDNIVVYFLEKVSQEVGFKQKLKKKAREMGLKKFSQRQVKVQIASGSYVSYTSLYAEQAPQDYHGDRSISRAFFKIKGGASPEYQSRVSQMSVITPSFSIAKDVLNNFKCESHPERNRVLSIGMGKTALENRVDNVLQSQETLSGQRVIIGIDGGRSRTREWKAESKSAYGEFETPWREPKMLVISTIDKEGKVDKKRLPIYDTSFGDDEIFDILRQYLQRLKINEAQSVQIVADGASWIWNRAKPMLLELGVQASKIIETLDYCHAIEHLNQLEVYLPKAVQIPTMKDLKDWLWEGKIDKMKNRLMEIFPDWAQNPLKPFDYFEKNQHRMNYKQFLEQNLPVGSGIIESGIRRIINLRFKCPSSFWNLENLEPLFFLRAAFLAGRWGILLNNLNKF